jgi:hypothetical protein
MGYSIYQGQQQQQNQSKHPELLMTSSIRAVSNIVSNLTRHPPA